jgi:hypothetical protein
MIFMILILYYSEHIYGTAKKYKPAKKSIQKVMWRTTKGRCVTDGSMSNK